MPDGTNDSGIERIVQDLIHLREGGSMDRRSFLRLLGRAGAVALLGPAVAGCSTTTPASSSTPATSGGPAASGSTSTTVPLTALDVSIAEDGDPAELTRRAVDGLGGMGRFVEKGAKVVVKPNVMSARAPEYGATTNPAVVAAVVTMCFEAGAAKVVVLDNPTDSPRPAFAESGIAKAVSDAGGDVKYLTERSFETVEFPDGKLLTSWPLVTDVLGADTFINIPIAKTHNLTGVSLGMKNLMGAIGGSRGQIHTGFADKIADLLTVLRPDLVVLDAYRVLVRHGPTGGNLSDVVLNKKVAAGIGSVEMDAVGVMMMGGQSSAFPHLVAAQERGMGETDPAKLRIRSV